MENLKDKNLAFILWLFLGAHYAYLGRWKMQILYWFTLGGLGLWCLIDLFRIGKMIKKHNAEVYSKLSENGQYSQQRQ